MIPAPSIPAAAPSHTDSLKDRFAGEALTGLLANPNGRYSDPEATAKLAYAHAEAMLRERRR